MQQTGRGIQEVLRDKLTPNNKPYIVSFSLIEESYTIIQFLKYLIMLMFMFNIQQ